MKPPEPWIYEGMMVMANRFYLQSTTNLHFLHFLQKHFFMVQMSETKLERRFKLQQLYYFDILSAKVDFTSPRLKIFSINGIAIIAFLDSASMSSQIWQQYEFSSPLHQSLLSTALHSFRWSLALSARLSFSFRTLSDPLQERWNLKSMTSYFKKTVYQGEVTNVRVWRSSPWNFDARHLRLVELIPRARTGTTLFFWHMAFWPPGKWSSWDSYATSWESVFSYWLDIDWKTLYQQYDASNADHKVKVHRVWCELDWPAQYWSYNKLLQVEQCDIRQQHASLKASVSASHIALVNTKTDSRKLPRRKHTITGIWVLYREPKSAQLHVCNSTTIWSTITSQQRQQYHPIWGLGPSLFWR